MHACMLHTSRPRPCLPRTSERGPFPNPSARSMPCTPAIESSIPEAARLIYAAEQNPSMSSQTCTSESMPESNLAELRYHAGWYESRTATEREFPVARHTCAVKTHADQFELPSEIDGRVWDCGQHPGCLGVTTLCAALLLPFRVPVCSRLRYSPRMATHRILTHSSQISWKDETKKMCVPF